MYHLRPSFFLTSLRVFIPTLLFTTALLAVDVMAQQVFVQPPTTIPTTQTFTVAIEIDTADENVMGVEVKLAFDSTFVGLVSIDAGDWFTTSGLSYYFWDYTTPGTSEIYFTGAQLGAGRSTGGTLAICTFTAQEPGISPLVFVVYDVRDTTNSPLAFTHSTGDQIVIQQAIPVPATTFGSLKALYQ